MIKNILTPLDPSDHTEAALFRAVEIAGLTNAGITGLTVVDTEGILNAVALPFHAEFLNFPPPKAVEMLGDAKEKLKSVRQSFEDKCAEKNVRFEMLQLKGNPAAGILDVGRFTDLLVMGLASHFHFETDEGAGDTLAQVLDGISVPVLLTPAFEQDPIRRVIVAYDGSPSATRALHSFARFWAIYSPEVRVVTSASDENIGEHLLDEAVKFLTSYGIQEISKELTKEPLEESFRGSGIDWADLIVAGVHSKNPLKRFFVGSFTRWQITESHRTLFLSQ